MVSTVRRTGSSPPELGFRVQRNWRRAAQCWRGYVNPIKHHAYTLEGIMALAGPSFQRAYDDFRVDPDGRRLLREKPAILDLLLDTESLARLPKGSLGHAYLDFMNQNRLDAALYDEAHDLPAIGERLGWDEDFYYTIHRGIILHDMLHVLGGYGPDIGGEFGVLGFTNGQVTSLGTKLFLPMILALPVGVPKKRLVRFWRQACVRGQAAGMLMAKPYEELLDQPIDEVRSRLGVAPFEAAHPEGPIYSTFQFGRRGDRMTDDAYAPYVYDPQRDHLAEAS